VEIMTKEVAILLKGVSKCFKRYDRPIDRLKEILLPGKSRASEFWALQDIDLEITRGETLGIIGQNGSGKSTLLQIIAGTLTPTTGQAQVNGRVSALLELGSGFNPEFTGRQNVFFNGRLLGLSQREIEERFDEIAGFADIKDFLDQPVKTYSSGMFVRLAFAVAVNVEPEILIVDEALAVGDMLFQSKCMTRMRRMIDAGITVLFVSHDTSSVKSLCQRCAFLEKGHMRKLGRASEVVASYVGTIHESMNKELKKQVEELEGKVLAQNHEDCEISEYENHKNSIETGMYVSTTKAVKFPDNAHRYGDGGAKILDIKLLNNQGYPTEELDFKEDFVIQISILFEKDLPTFCFGYLIRDIKGIDLIGTTTVVEKNDMPSTKSGDVYVAEIKVPNVLNSGIYTLTFAVEQPVVLNQQHVFLDWIDNAVVFRVNNPEDALDRFTSRVYVSSEIRCLKIRELKSASLRA
jgi:ABC-type polysaccharide/polyol phosphate transport system ATPase subunit